MRKAEVPKVTTMKLTGHNTLSMYLKYSTTGHNTLSMYLKYSTGGPKDVNYAMATLECS
jgi:hypothetical protein